MPLGCEQFVWLGVLRGKHFLPANQSRASWYCRKGRGWRGQHGVDLLSEMPLLFYLRTFLASILHLNQAPG